MFKRLMVNTLVSLLAYAAISVVGLVVVPVLVATYGLTLYGLIVAARLWAPVGILGMVDLGVGEAATLTIARARSSENYAWAGARVIWLSLIALTIGVICGGVIWLFAAQIVSLQVVPQGEYASYLSILGWSAVALPILFLSLVFEGVVKGFENYSSVRAIEVFSSLLYGGGCFVVVWFEGSYQAVAYVFIAAALLRAGMSGVMAWRSLSRRENVWSGMGHSSLSDCWQQMQPLATNKLLTTLQTQMAPLLIGGLVGPGGLAVYDILVRLPRFAKAVLGLVNSAVMPFAARLEAASHVDKLTRLMTYGLPLVAAATMPPLFAAATFSEPILRLWIGHELVAYWYWQSLMFFVPVLSVLLGFGATALATRERIPGKLNRLLALQLIVQLAVGFATVSYFQERAFLLSQVVATFITFYWQFKIIFQAQALEKETALKMFGMGLVGFVLGACSLPFVSKIETIFELVFFGATFVLTYLASCFFIFIDKEVRKKLIKIIV